MITEEDCKFKIDELLSIDDFIDDYVGDDDSKLNHPFVHPDYPWATNYTFRDVKHMNNGMLYSFYWMSGRLDVFENNLQLSVYC